MRIVLLFLLSFHCSAAFSHSIFIATHAEIQHKKNDPSLSQCGRVRAKQLSTLLSHSNIANVYSTTDRRNMETANPTAQKNNVPVKIFTLKLLDSIAITSITENKNVLIISDQKSVEFLVEFISKQAINLPMNNSQQMLYQIIIPEGQQPILNVLKQPLQC